MGNLRDDHGNRKTGKRKFEAISGGGFRNDFNEPAPPGNVVIGPDNPNHAYSPDWKDGHDSTTMKKQEDIGGSPNSSTPSPVKRYKRNPPSPSPSPSSIISSQTASNTSRFHISDSAATGVMITLNTSSNHENSYSWKEDASHDEILDLIAARRLFESPTTRKVFDSHKSNLEPTLLGRLKELSEMEPAYKVGLEMADSLYLLKVLSSPNLELETVGKKARKGAMLLQEGERLMTEGRNLLRSAITDMSTFIE